MIRHHNNSVDQFHNLFEREKDLSKSLQSILRCHSRIVMHFYALHWRQRLGEKFRRSCHRTLRGSGPRMETSASGLFSSDLICQILLVLAAQWTTGPCVVFSSVSTKGDRRSCFRRHANPGPKILICCSQLNRRQPCRGFLRVCAFLMNTHQLD